MAIKLGKLGRAAFSGGIIATAPLIAACSSGPSYDDWAATDGAAGRINLDDVQEAFRNSKSPTDFETRVNEIYEGDGLIFIRASQDGEKLVLEGWEDLNGNNVIDDGQDDRLFSIVKENNEYDMRGHHANGYYNSHFGAGNFLFTYMIISSLNRPYYYQTPVGRGTTMRQQRTSYRQSSKAQQPGGEKQPILQPAAEIRRVSLPAGRPECQQQPADLPANPKVHRRI